MKRRALSFTLAPHTPATTELRTKYIATLYGEFSRNVGETSLGARGCGENLPHNIAIRLCVIMLPPLARTHTPAAAAELRTDVLRYYAASFRRSRAHQATFRRHFVRSVAPAEQRVGDTARASALCPRQRHVT